MEEVSVRLENFINEFGSKIHFIGPKNPKVKEVLSLINNSKPNKNNFFILDGIWAHEKALKNNIEIDSFIFCSELINSHEAMNLIEESFKRAKNTYSISLKTFEKLAEKDSPKGLLSIAKFPYKTIKDIKLKKDNLIVVLDGLEIPGNIGTILRTCDGSNVDAVFICNRKARLTHPKIIKGSMGAAFIVPVVEFDSVNDCISYLKKNNFDIYLTDTRAKSHYFELEYKNRVAIVAGSERYGISRPWYDEEVIMLSIPMLGQSDSLNVAIATTIVVYEASMKRLGFIKGSR